MKPEIGMRNGRKWAVVTKNVSDPNHSYQTVWEAHENGEYTAWSYSLYGEIGITGTPKPDADIKIEPARQTKKHLALIEEMERRLASAIRRSESWATVYKGGK